MAENQENQTPENQTPNQENQTPDAARGPLIASRRIMRCQQFPPSPQYLAVSDLLSTTPAILPCFEHSEVTMQRFCCVLIAFPIAGWGNRA